MIVIKNERIESIPLLHVVNQKLDSEKLPLVVFIHGFTSAKEHNLHYAYLLAEKGFRVVMPDALYHGQRDMVLSEQELYIHFWDIVITTIHDLKKIKNHFLEQKLIDPDKIGVVGTSMGAIATLGALTQYEWIKAAVSLMGLANFGEFSLWQLEQIKKQGYMLNLTNEQIDRQLSILSEYDLSLHQHKLNNRPLLFWHAKNDNTVPYSLTYPFYKNIKNGYEQNPEKLEFITDEYEGHKVSKAGVKATVDWFSKFLK
ncbi:MAG: alpha/beta fold hydrolase [Bacillota bacterium]|nr:alpha/beta fold hydrolase [Bacillota bacterium]